MHPQVSQAAAVKREIGGVHPLAPLYSVFSNLMSLRERARLTVVNVLVYRLIEVEMGPVLRGLVLSISLGKLELRRQIHIVWVRKRREM